MRGCSYATFIIIDKPNIMSTIQPVKNPKRNATTMSKIDDLRAKMAELAAELAKEEANTKANALTKIDKLVQEANLTPADLLEHFGLGGSISKKSPTSKATRNSPKAKYRLPTGEEWSGRGLPSRAVKAMLDKGHSLSEFLIDKP